MHLNKNALANGLLYEYINELMIIKYFSLVMNFV